MLSMHEAARREQLASAGLDPEKRCRTEKKNN